MMEKRMRKLNNFVMDEPFKVNGEKDSDLLVISFLSVNGVAAEAIGRFDEDIVGNITHVQLKQLHPFPAEALYPYLEGAKDVLVIEQNYSAQLFNIVKMNYHMHSKMKSRSEERRVGKE